MFLVDILSLTFVIHYLNDRSPRESILT